MRKSARLNRPHGFAIDHKGNLFVTDQGNNKVKKIHVEDREVETIAGSGHEGDLEGVGSAASFNYSHGIAVDTDGNLFVAD